VQLLLGLRQLTACDLRIDSIVIVRLLLSFEKSLKLVSHIIAEVSEMDISAPDFAVVSWLCNYYNRRGSNE